MATKRMSPMQKSKPNSPPELALALTEYKSIYKEVHETVPMAQITEFKSIPEALSTFITACKQITYKLSEFLHHPLHLEQQNKYDELKSIMQEEVKSK